jgi:large subunit ribosomal protein L6
MSKIGRKPIDIQDLQVEIVGQDVRYKGRRASGTYTLPEDLTAVKENNTLVIKPVKETRDTNRIWGLHRALLANALKGASAGFEKRIEIVGLGYKATVAGNKVTFSLGYSHKIDFDLPAGVALVVDKTGQSLTFSSHDRALLGNVCGRIKELRVVEPYKGTGIKGIDDLIFRKAGKTKAS